MDGYVAVLMPLILLILAGAGYLIRRIIEGSRETERVKAIRDWVEVHKAMYGTPPTVQDVDRLRTDFLKRTRLTEQEYSPLHEQTAISVGKPEPASDWMFHGYELTDWEKHQAAKGKGIWPQLDLNEKAHQAFTVIDSHLNAELRRWQLSLDEERGSHLASVQASWISFRDAQATLNASEYKGGTIAPMIYWGSMFEETQRRLKALEGQRALREIQ